MQTYIKNKNGLRLFVLVEGDLMSDKLVFITHGLSGSHDQPHIAAMRKTFVENGYTVVSYDTAYSFGKSEGDSVHATASSYISDLEDVVKWAQYQEWYKEPFVLAGHSLGGISSLVYAHRHKDKVRAIFPMSTVVSGGLWHKVHQDTEPENYRKWKEKGYYFKESMSMPGRSGKVGWGLAEDMNNYNALMFASDIHCPVLLMTGSEDTGTSPEMHRMLLEKLGGRKRLHIIEGMEHTPREQSELDEMADVLKEWLKTL